MHEAKSFQFTIVSYDDRPKQCFFLSFVKEHAMPPPLRQHIVDCWRPKQVRLNRNAENNVRHMPKLRYVSQLSIANRIMNKIKSSSHAKSPAYPVSNAAVDDTEVSW